MELNLQTIKWIAENKQKTALINFLFRLLGSEHCTDISDRCNITELYHYSHEGVEVFISKPHETDDICIAALKPTMRMLRESSEYEYVRATMKARGFNKTFEADDLYLSGEHRELFEITIISFKHFVWNS